nr:hypothetical protein CFP56_12134 [Quercus suber]
MTCLPNLPAPNVLLTYVAGKSARKRAGRENNRFGRNNVSPHRMQAAMGKGSTRVLFSRLHYYRCHVLRLRSDIVPRRLEVTGMPVLATYSSTGGIVGAPVVQLGESAVDRHVLCVMPGNPGLLR